jgi:hypothetical protein
VAATLRHSKDYDCLEVALGATKAGMKYEGEYSLTLSFESALGLVSTLEPIK